MNKKTIKTLMVISVIGIVIMFASIILINGIDVALRTVVCLAFVALYLGLDDELYHMEEDSYYIMEEENENLNVSEENQNG